MNVPCQASLCLLTCGCMVSGPGYNLLSWAVATATNLLGTSIWILILAATLLSCSCQKWPFGEWLPGHCRAASVLGTCRDLWVTSNQPRSNSHSPLSQGGQLTLTVVLPARCTEWHWALDGWMKLGCLLDLGHFTQKEWEIQKSEHSTLSSPKTIEFSELSLSSSSQLWGNKTPAKYLYQFFLHCRNTFSHYV